jgi:CRISPR-associated protein Cas1
MQKDGRVLYLTEAKEENLYWNIPIANTTVVLLGTGTSITQAAMRMLASAGVLVGFCGGGGTPLIMGTEIEWLTPQSEYRPTEYIQGWLKFWFDESKRLTVAKAFQDARIDYLKRIWDKDRDLKAENFYSDDREISAALNSYAEQVNTAQKVGDLLLREAALTKQLYRYAAKSTQLGDFVREREATDLANGFLNHGNYLAYGLAAIDFQKLNFQKCKKYPFEVMLVSAKKKPPKEYLNDNTKLLKINFGKAVRKLTDSQKARQYSLISVSASLALVC